MKILDKKSNVANFGVSNNKRHTKTKQLKLLNTLHYGSFNNLSDESYESSGKHA